MARALYSISPDDYEFSDSFEILNSEITIKKSTIDGFIIDGDKLVKQKQDKLNADLKALYEKDEESGRIFEQHEHFQQSSINESLRESFLFGATTLLYSQFEYSLKEIAKKTAELFQVSITNGDLEKYKPKTKGRKRNKLSKVATYLFFIDETAKIKISDLNSYWNEIVLFQQARNCITHNNGYVGSNHPKLKELTNSNKGISYDIDSDRITISKEYLMEMNKICNEFLKKLMEKVWLNRPKSR